MDRLTERDKDRIHGWGIMCRRCDELWRSRCLECSERTRLYTRLADYEDAEEQGRLIEFPVAIGQHLWRVEQYPPRIIEMVVTLLQVADNGDFYAHGQETETRNDHYFTLRHIGQILFCTREEAEAKLKEMEADNHGDT